MKRKVVILGIFITIINNLFCFNISNTNFDQRIDKETAYKEFVLKNNSRESIRYKVKIFKSDNSYMDMSKWVRVSPKVLNIKPLSEKVLKIFAKSPKKAKKGEYGFRIRIEPIIIPTIKKAKEGLVSGSSMVGVAPIIQMLGYVGDADFKKNIKLENVKLKKKDGRYFITGLLKNDSFAGKNIGFNFLSHKGYSVGESWVGRMPSGFNQKIEVPVNGKIEQIVIFDGETREEIKRVIIPKQEN